MVQLEVSTIRIFLNHMYIHLTTYFTPFNNLFSVEETFLYPLHYF